MSLRKMNKPVYVGMSILDLSKTLMFSFQYEYVKKKWEKSEVLYTDTDSLVLKIETEDFFKDISGDVAEYPPPPVSQAILAKTTVFTSMVGVGRAVKRTVFGDSLTVYLKELHVPVEYVTRISMFWGQNCPKLKLSTFVIHEMLVEHLKGKYQQNVQRENEP